MKETKRDCDFPDLLNTDIERIKAMLIESLLESCSDNTWQSTLARDGMNLVSHEDGYAVYRSPLFRTKKDGKEALSLLATVAPFFRQVQYADFSFGDDCIIKAEELESHFSTNIFVAYTQVAVLPPGFSEDSAERPAPAILFDLEEKTIEISDGFTDEGRKAMLSMIELAFLKSSDYRSVMNRFDSKGCQGDFSDEWRMLTALESQFYLLAQTIKDDAGSESKQ